MEKNKVIGENYPKIGEKFYWKGINGDIYEEICMKIEQKDNPYVETMYFTYISPNGGGTFVTEDCIVDPMSIDIVKYKEKKAKEKLKEISDYISQKEVKQILFEKLIKHAFTNNEANKILNILSNYD